MFNGIIFNQGIVKKILKRRKGINIFLKSNLKLTNNNLGVSVSCDGVCLTLISIKSKLIEFYLSNETLKRSKFKSIKIGDHINLELPLKKGQKISGHICQGHVDTTAKILKITKKDKSIIYDFKINKNFKKQLVNKASILVNGVSLTISDITKNGFKIWTIPHTLKLTNLSKLKKGTIVNIEIDILSKYVKKYFHEKK
tara:strand:+ start:600 stop:1193 length:594 start_codon:yes stop_codon:yes gene_type:complete